MKYIIQQRATGTLMSEFNSLEQAKIELKLYELYDHKDGIYTSDAYEIVENKADYKATLLQDEIRYNNKQKKLTKN